MEFISKFGELRLDIVGLVAILGEGGTSRNAQASALSWHHILPRLYPAPQALLKPQQQKRLPVEPGVVVGALSGRVRNELNFFIQLLHDDDLPEYAVQLLEVKRKDSDRTAEQSSQQSPTPAFEVKKHGHLAALSVLGFCMSIALLALSVWQKDGPALMATISLSMTSSFVGLASWCVLDVKEEVPNESRTGKTPLGDVVIFYPRNGAFRVIRCTDQISRLYFRVENCKHFFKDNTYRLIALVSTILLMAGLIMLSNSKPIMQAAFAASYVLLNALYWLSSALNPAQHVWKHDFTVKEIFVTKKIRMNPQGLAVPPQEKLVSAKGGVLISSEVASVVGRTRQYHADKQEKQMERIRTFHFIARNTDSHHPQEWTATAWSRSWRFLCRFAAFAFNMETKIGTSARADRHSSIALGNMQPNQSQPVTAGADPNSKQRLDFRQDQDQNMTSALWTAIALTGKTQWARTTNIAPDHEVWNAWLAEASKRASPAWSRERQLYVPPCAQARDIMGNIWVQLPTWNCQKRLSELFEQYGRESKQKYTVRHEPPDATIFLDEAWRKQLRGGLPLSVVRRLRALCQTYRERKAQGNTAPQI
ncbi:hypothetical protein H2198_001946 [Neophaeococcomyces mojaviensis]|uniref:Uncharacterized protein n=1 Tax=Neophaeococcomyces mojaviensis TaxID=3383035 RepID=A0ACC3AG03_9EURO|nr:hypothetical protein H2198_001946 [Knufia sp. JES_112]